MKKIRKVFLLIDDIVHISVAFLLVFAAFAFLYQAFTKAFSPDTQSILEMVGDALFVLLIMEILWDVLRYFKKLPFTLRPFIFVGIISSIRGMVLVEAKMSIGFEKIPLFHQLAKIGIFAIVVFILCLCLYLLGKTPSHDPEE
ncbi:MAG: phosphate-starvation-inducible PsiE family protein [bacterium]